MVSNYQLAECKLGVYTSQSILSFSEALSQEATKMRS